MDQAAPAYLLGTLCFAGIGILIGLLVGAVILRAAVSIVNLIVGGENSAYGIPAPGLGWGMVIVLVNAIVGGAINFGVGFGIGILLRARPDLFGPMDAQWLSLLPAAITLPVNFLVSSFLNALMLPTSVGRGMVVTIFQYIIAIVIAAIVVGVIFALGLGMSINRWR